MRDQNDPTVLGETILRVKEELKCTVVQAADIVYRELAARGTFYVAPPPAESGRADTRAAA